MKIINQGKDLTKAHIGKKLLCKTCNCFFELEKTDQPRRAHSIIYRNCYQSSCPNCGDIIDFEL